MILEGIGYRIELRLDLINFGVNLFAPRSGPFASGLSLGLQRLIFSAFFYFTSDLPALLRMLFR